MSAAGRNVVKMIVGSAIGASIGTLVARVVEGFNQSAQERVPIRTSLSGWTRTKKESWREYWERLNEAGELARIEKEEAMRESFRSKVSDPNALMPVEEPAIDEPAEHESQVT